MGFEGGKRGGIVYVLTSETIPGKGGIEGECSGLLRIQVIFG